MVIKNSYFLPIGRDVYCANGCCLLHNWDWEAIINEYFENTPVLAADKQAFSLGWTTQRFDILNCGLNHPFSLEDPCESQQLNFLFEAKNEMVRKHKEPFAINFLVDLFVGLVLHVVWVVWRHAVNDDFLIELHSKSILVNGNLFDVVSAPDFDSSFGDKMLNYNIGHQLSVGIPFLVESMNLVHLYVGEHDLAVICSCKNSSVGWVDRD